MMLSRELYQFLVQNCPVTILKGCVCNGRKFYAEAYHLEVNNLGSSG